MLLKAKLAIFVWKLSIVTSFVGVSVTIFAGVADTGVMHIALKNKRVMSMFSAFLVCFDMIVVLILG